MEQRERRQLANDASLRDSGTFFSHTHSDAGGRFAAVGAATVIGSTAVPQYPAASSPVAFDPVPKEEPLGYCIDAMPELEPSSSAPVQATGPTLDGEPPSSPLGDAPRAGVGPSFIRRRKL
jgi:hypothetical protein